MSNRIPLRPRTARAVAGRADTLDQFGMNLRDWFHELRKLNSKASLLGAVAHRPPRLRTRFPGGEIADAFLAAQVEHLCNGAGLPPPRWVGAPEYILQDPWFGSTTASRDLRAILIREAPVEFKNRNLFTTPEIKWRPGRGRPRKSAGEKRETNRLRQLRWRAAR